MMRPLRVAGLLSFSAVILVTMVFVQGCRGKNGRPVAHVQPLYAWNASGVDVASFMIANDFDNLVEQTDSLLEKSDLAYMSHVDVVTTAKDYESDFNANEIAADQKYVSKRILVYGKINSINKDALGGGYFTLASSNLIGVQAHLSQEALAPAAKAKRGDRVALECESGPRILEFATLIKCSYLSQYLSREHVTPDEQVHDFFNRGLPLPYKEAYLATFAYAFATAPSIPKACTSQPSATTCDVTKWQLNTTQQQKLKGEANAILDDMKTKHAFIHVACADPIHELPEMKVEAGVCVKIRTSP